MDLQQLHFMDSFNHKISCSHKRGHKESHYIVCTSLSFPFFKVGLERTKDLELFNDFMLGEVLYLGFHSAISKGFFFYYFLLSECFLACRQYMSRENSVCSFKNSPKHFSLCEDFLKLKQKINSKSNSLLSHPCNLFLIPLRIVYHSSAETKISSI